MKENKNQSVVVENAGSDDTEIDLVELFYVFLNRIWLLVMCLVILVMAEPKYCFPSFSMNSTATNIPMKYIYFSQFLTFIILPVSYALDILRTLIGWSEKPAV